MGYGFSVILGSIICEIILHAWYSQYGGRKDWTRTLIIGIIEKVLYTTSYLINEPEFIIGWLIFKAAGRCGIEESKESKYFNGFLIGNGFSLFYGVIGGMIIIKYSHKEALIFTIVLFCFSILSILWIYIYGKISKLNDKFE